MYTHTYILTSPTYIKKWSNLQKTPFLLATWIHFPRCSWTGCLLPNFWLASCCNRQTDGRTDERMYAFGMLFLTTFGMRRHIRLLFTLTSFRNILMRLLLVTSVYISAADVLSDRFIEEFRNVYSLRLQHRRASNWLWKSSKTLLGLDGSPFASYESRMTCTRFLS